MPVAAETKVEKTKSKEVVATVVAGEWVEATRMATSSPKLQKFLIPQSPKFWSPRAHPVEAPLHQKSTYLLVRRKARYREPCHLLLLRFQLESPLTHMRSTRSEDVCKIYEEDPRTTFPNIPSVWGPRHLIPSFTYDFTQSFEFIDQLVHRSCLFYQRTINTYAPYNKDWSKEKTHPDTSDTPNVNTPAGEEVPAPGKVPVSPAEGPTPTVPDKLQAPAHTGTEVKMSATPARTRYPKPWHL